MGQDAAVARPDPAEIIGVARAVREAGPAAVKAAAQCLLCLRKGNKIAMEASQLKNLLEAASACGDLRSIETWVLYQMGRHQEWRATASSADASNSGSQQEGSQHMFGHRVVAQFGPKDGPLRKAAKTRPLTGEALDEAELEIVRLFAGQLSRLHKYVQEMVKIADEHKDETKAKAAWCRIECLGGDAS